MHTVVGPLVVTALVIIALGGVYSKLAPSLTLLNSSGSLAIFAAIRRAFIAHERMMRRGHYENFT
jgi:hypothetical protein